MLIYQSTSVLEIEMRSSPERILCTCVKGKQEFEVLHIQYSYNSRECKHILLVSLLSRVSGSLRTTPFHFF